ncbi:MAG: hypothetical protein AAB421_05100 [Patescibacteria group bacterium]
MNFPKKLQDFHHAYSARATTTEILAELASRGVMSASPDVFRIVTDVLKIDDARDIRMRAQTRPVELARRIFIIEFVGATTDAQNALLKSLEEPTIQATFFLLTPRPYQLLATLRSRVEMIGGIAARTAPHLFLSAHVDTRMDIIKKMTKEKEDRTIGEPLTILRDMEYALASLPYSPKKIQALRSVYLAERYLADNGASIKHLLEQVAILVPKL